MRSGISFYLFIGVLFIAMLFITLRYFNGSGRSTVGVTYAKNYKINAEKAARIKSVHVVPGQEVKQGDMLVELTSQELEMDIDKLKNKISTQRAELKERAKLVESEVAYLDAEHNLVLEEIDADIDEIKNDLKLNQQLTKEFIGTPEKSDPSQQPLQLKIGMLDQRKKKHTAAMSIKVQDAMLKSRTEQAALQNQITLLERELVLLLDEEKKLSKFATFNGVIENVFVKNGEEINAFAALLSVNPTHPTTVIGYFTGKKERDIPVGHRVTVMSYDHNSVSTLGKVIGFGAVVELPEILQKSTAVKAFGREVFIEIDPANDFATGEKVLIK
jgi:HlyD family secretion protein